MNKGSHLPNVPLQLQETVAEKNYDWGWKIGGISRVFRASGDKLEGAGMKYRGQAPQQGDHLSDIYSLGLTYYSSLLLTPGPVTRLFSLD